MSGLTYQGEPCVCPICGGLPVLGLVRWGQYGQFDCGPECDTVYDQIMSCFAEDDNTGPVSWCCICGGLGSLDGSKCWGCQ